MPDREQRDSEVEFQRWETYTRKEQRDKKIGGGIQQEGGTEEKEKEHTSFTLHPSDPVRRKNI